MAAVGGVGHGNMGLNALNMGGDARQKNIDNVAEQVKALFSDFLHQYSSDESSNGRQSTTPTNTPTPSQSLSERDYVVQVQRMKETEKTTLWVNFEHLADDPYYVVRDSIEQHYYRVYPTLCAAVQAFVLEHAPNHPRAKDEYNPFHVAFYNLPANLTIRDLKTAQIGRLVSICGTVTRTSQVRPELSIATFRCLDCGVINRGVAQQFKYTEPTTCINPVCTNRINFELDPTLCSFVDFQSLRVQENSSEIPPGSMPRSLRVILRNDIVDSAKPGDKCIFAGTLLVVPDVRQMSKPSAARGGGGGRRSNTGREEGRRDRDNNEGGVSGLRELGIRDLSYSLVFLASSVKSMHANMSGWGAFAFGGEEVSADSNDMDALADKMKKLFTEEERRRVKEMSEKSRIYSRLVQSIAPSIAGHEDIKRGILLMLFGGVHKRTSDNASLRGDINVCIVGDPSTSKSQFLKYVCTFLPRAVYTSGKASSAAGLTASVVKDVETGEFGIEAGALMLADNGICCIDEFDKMDPNDQVAIHEAMEQQTISIAKAGVKATLNARTSILAAANPIGGRYDRSKTLKQNIDISAPIMSRFDLFFVVLDENDPSIDFNVARHIVNIHNQRPLHQPDFSMDDLQLYIRFARSIIKPQLTPEAREYLVNAFVTLRQDDSSGASRSSFRITTRQLESLIRLAEARARVDLSDDIKEEHAREAVRLLKKSIVHVESRDVDLEEEEEIEESGKDEMKDDNNDDNQDDDNNDDNNDDDGHGRRRNPDPENKEDDADRTRSPAAKSTPKAPAASGAKKHVPITMVEYRRITQLLVHMVQEYERKSNKVGMEQAELIREFVGQEKEADDTNDLQRQIKMVNLVIHRLLNVDRILIEVPSVDGKPRKITERQLTVHPNYTPDILPKILEAKRKYGDEDDDKRPLSKKDAEFALAKLRSDTLASPSVVDASNELKSPERPTKRMKGDETPSQPIDETVDHQSADDVKALIRASKTATPARTSTDTPSTTNRRRGRGSASPAVRSPTATPSAPSPSPASTRRAKRSSPSK